MDIFYAMDCLTERTSMLKGLEIQRKYLKGADKRIIGQYLHKLLKYNQKAFEFLGVKAAVEGLDLNSSLIFSSSNYIGCVPLRASDTGKQIGDFLVKPRYISHQQYHEYLEILNLLGNDISPEYLEGLSLRSGNALRPPRFLEAIKFIGILSELSSFSWQKFAVVEHQLPCPSGHVNWDKYSKLSGKPEKALIFPQNKNILTERHPEYAKLKYVFEICKKLVNSSNVPMQLKRTTYTKIGFLDKRLAHISIEATDLIPIKQSDKKILQDCKKQANLILRNQELDCPGWRLDVAKIFERYVQYVFTDIASVTGAKLHKNFKLNGQFTKQSSWQIKYLEPDAVYQKDMLMVFIDAKYKSHLYNAFHDSEALKEEHRRDLHQILAYASFSHGLHKSAVLCYPSQTFQSKPITYKNPANGSINKIVILGLPMNIGIYKTTKQAIVDILIQLEVETAI